MFPLVLSYVQAERLLAAWKAGQRTSIASPDLNLTTVEVALEPGGVRFPSGASFPNSRLIAWEELESVCASERGCFVVEPGGLRKIQFFSGLTNQLYSLMPTGSAPTMLISGLPMHRIKDTDPHRDTLEKIKAIAPIAGRVLDTATGLGYTAIQAAKTAERVVTIELDPTALEVARLNPWSQPLFDNPKIEQHIGDSFDEMQHLPDAAFARIIHDPPMFKLAGDLYSREFYCQLFRVLRPKGRLFHYIGDLESKSGRVVAKGVTRRLREVGFGRVMPRPAAFGVVAFK